MPNFTGESAMPRRRKRSVWLALLDGRFSFGVLGAGGERREDFGQVILVEDLAVGREVALVDAVQIAALDIEGVEAEVLGDFVNQFSIAAMPCGPPKPRKAVFGG